MSTLLGIAAPGLVPVPVLRDVAVNALERFGLVARAAEFARADPMDPKEWRAIRTVAGVVVVVLEPVDKPQFEIATELFGVCSVALERIARSAARRRAVSPEHH